MNKIKSLCLMVLLVVGLLAVSGIASAAQITAIREVKVNGEVITEAGTNDVRGLEKNDEFDVKVKLRSDVALSDAQVEATVRGYDHKDLIEDITDVFDMDANITYYKKLTLKLPVRMDQDTYRLRVIVSDRNNQEEVMNYELKVDTVSHGLEIRDVVLSPEDEVKAGRALLTSVRVKNRGEKDEEDVKVKVSIPALGISASDYIDEIDREDCDDEDCDDSVTSEELYMRIPDDAATGEYTVKVEVEYDDGDEVETKTTSIMVIGVEQEEEISAPAVKAKTIITVGPETQDVSAGGTVLYPVTITNAGTAARTYTVEVDSADWAEFQLTPSNVVVLNAGESKAVYIQVTAKQTAAAGEQMFSVSVKSGDTTLKQVPLKADVKAVATGSGIKKVLEVGLIVLVVILVIIGLIIGFSKLKGSEEEETREEGKETYY